MTNLLGDNERVSYLIRKVRLLRDENDRLKESLTCTSCERDLTKRCYVCDNDE